LTTSFAPTTTTYVPRPEWWGGYRVIPREIEAEVFEGAWSKAHGEKRVFEAIKGGMSAQQAWDRYGIF